MRIRAYAERDAAGVCSVYRRSVEALGLRDYSPEQVAVWASRTPDAAAMHARLSDGRDVIVAANDADAVVGFSDLEADGHIDLLYCSPETAGSGIALLLFATAEAIARQRGLERLYSEASEAALRFFLRRGFVLLHRRDLMIGDVAIHNFAVEKVLN
jgi:putative acetyltransferase